MNIRPVEYRNVWNLFFILECEKAIFNLESPTQNNLSFPVMLKFYTFHMLVSLLADTAAILRAQENFWPGVYEVEFLVKDEQGLACPEPQKVKVQVCTCEDGVLCGKRGASGRTSKGAELGPAGIGLLFLGLLLLLRECDVVLILIKGCVIKDSMCSRQSTG